MTIYSSVFLKERINYEYHFKNDHTRYGFIFRFLLDFSRNNNFNRRLKC
nr:MAG TPA: hypothetical protein [Caudoviricetes sp.]